MISHLVTSAALAFITFTAFAQADDADIFSEWVTLYTLPNCAGSAYITYADYLLYHLSELQGADGCSPPNHTIHAVIRSVQIRGLPNSKLYGWSDKSSDSSKKSLIPGSEDWYAPKPSTENYIIPGCNNTAVDPNLLIGVTWIQMYTGNCPPK